MTDNHKPPPQGQLVVIIDRTNGESVFSIRSEQISANEIKEIANSLLKAAEKIAMGEDLPINQDCQCERCVAMRAETKEHNKKNPNVN